MKRKDKERLLELLEKWEKGLANGEDLCVELDINQGEQWMQLTIDLLNIFWPFGKEEGVALGKKLTRFFPRVKLIDLVEKSYITYQIELIPPKEIIQLVEWLIEEEYGIGKTYEFDAVLVPLEND